MRCKLDVKKSNAFAVAGRQYLLDKHKQLNEIMPIESRWELPASPITCVSRHRVVSTYKLFIIVIAYFKIQTARGLI
jgi:hypothetical protein